MRRPHVYERSAPRIGRDGYKEPDSRVSTARLLAAQLGNMVEKADQAGLTVVSTMIEAARVEAERVALG